MSGLLYSMLYPKLSKECFFAMSATSFPRELVALLTENGIGLRVRFKFDDGREIFNHCYSSQELSALVNADKVDSFNEFYAGFVEVANEDVLPLQMDDGTTLVMLDYEKGDPTASDVFQLPYLTKVIALNDDVLSQLSENDIDNFLSEYLSLFATENPDCSLGMGYRLIIRALLYGSKGNLIREKSIINNM